MTNRINFFTPVIYEGHKTFTQNVQGLIENYFYLGGKAAYVIPRKIKGNSQEVVLRRKDQATMRHIIEIAIKIISYAIVIFPLIMLAAKIAFRATHKFYIAENKVANLMDQFTKAWDINTQEFDLSGHPFNPEQFANMLSSHAEQFKKVDVSSEQHFGYIEKFDLDPSQKPKIYMRADLHGDLKSLIENLRSLQQQKLLDENFRCQPGVHLVFLGDYCDRGSYGA